MGILVGVLYYMRCEATIVRSRNRDDNNPGRDHVFWLALCRRSEMSARGRPRVKFLRVRPMLFSHPGQWDAAMDKGGFS